MLKKLIVVTVVLAVAAIGESIPNAVPVPKGVEMVPIPVLPLKENEASITSFASGNVFQQTPGYQGGITTYDYQTNGAMGNRIAVDPDGDVHICWMHDDDENFVNRDIYYNVWEKSTGKFIWGSGVKASGTGKAGYTTIALLSDSVAVVAYHHDPDGDGIYQSAVSIDAFSKGGAFSPPIDIDAVTVPEQPIWPHMVVDNNDVIHVTAHISPADPDNPPYNVDYLYYSRSTDRGQSFSEWEVITQHAGNDVGIATSKDGKVAIAWLGPVAVEGTGRITSSGHIYYVESTTGGASWSAPVKVTDGRYRDDAPNGPDAGLWFWAWSPDIDCAYDEAGNLHIGWGEGLRAYEDRGEEGLWFYSYNRWWLRMMHWSEVSNDFNVVSGLYTMFHFIDENGDTVWEIDTLGMWGIAQRVEGYYHPFLGCGNPQLAAMADGDMVYTWVGQWDSLDITGAGSINADIYASISTDGGATWEPVANLNQIDLDLHEALGVLPKDRLPELASFTNLTNTPSYNAKIGESLSEEYHSVWPWIGSDDILHITYIHDLFAGSCLHTPTTGIFTENLVMYLPVTVGRALTMKTDVLSDVEEISSAQAPVIEVISQQPVTNFVTFSVNAPATHASLKIYDAAGSLVEEVFEGRLDANRIVTWNTREVPAGVYFYSFVTPSVAMNGRVVVVH